MPKKAKELSPIEIKRLTVQGLYAVGGVAGLMLQVSPSGSRSWILRVKIGDKRRDIGLGGYPDVTLAQARDSARELRDQIKQGIDPVLERKANRIKLAELQNSIMSFDDAARKFLLSKNHEFKNKKHAAQWGSTLKTYASPIIGKLPVSDIELHHIVRILEPEWLTKTETMKRVRGRIEAVLTWATVKKYRIGENPARWKGHLEIVMPKPSKIAKVTHHKALPIEEINQFMTALKDRKGMSAKALEFVILTATRSGEVRGATWDEINLTNHVWTIPEDRMKMGKEHRIPLSDQAIKLLNALPRLENNNQVFFAPRGGMLSDMSLSAVTKRMDVKAVPHGFRSTFRDWCSEYTNYPRDVAEMALAHSIQNKVESAYRRGDLFIKRTMMMQDWATFCNTPLASGEVIPIMREIK